MCLYVCHCVCVGGGALCECVCVWRQVRSGVHVDLDIYTRVDDTETLVARLLDI